jgi:hypothetical protein
VLSVSGFRWWVDRLQRGQVAATKCTCALSTEQLAEYGPMLLLPIMMLYWPASHLLSDSRESSAELLTGDHVMSRTLTQDCHTGVEKYQSLQATHSERAAAAACGLLG